MTRLIVGIDWEKAGMARLLTKKITKMVTGKKRYPWMYIHWVLWIFLSWLSHNSPNMRSVFWTEYLIVKFNYLKHNKHFFFNATHVKSHQGSESYISSKRNLSLLDETALLSTRKKNFFIKFVFVFHGDQCIVHRAQL